MENNVQSTRKCPACGAENKSTYRFCNVCGAVMDQPAEEPVQAVEAVTPEVVAEPVAEPVNEPAAEQATYDEQATISFELPTEVQAKEFDPNKEYMNAQAAVGDAPDFDDVTAAEMFTYTGYRYNLFKIMQKLHFIPDGKKFSWCLLFCGLLFGFFGMSMWYLYHKVYKHAYIFLAAGVALFAVNTLANYMIFDSILGEFMNVLRETSDIIPGLVRGDIGAVFNVVEVVFKDVSLLGIIFLGLGSVGGIVQFVFAIIMPFSAFKSYKKTAMSRIRKARISQKSSVAKMGGFKGTTTAIVSIIILVVTTVLPIALVGSFAIEAIDYYERNSGKIKNLFTYAEGEITGDTQIQIDYDI